MKVSAFILAVIVLWFSGMPCSDVETNKTTATEMSAAAQNQPEDHHRDADACSPFCTCACCASVNFKALHSPDTKIPLGLNSKNVIVIPSEIVDISLPIWQPPQLNA